MEAPINAIVEVVGFPGVGKLSIAKRLAVRTGLTLIDNHATNDPLFAVIGIDGVAPPPAEIWQYVERARNVVLDVVEALAPPGGGFILTNVAVEDEADRRLSARLQDLSHARGAAFVPVLLTCDLAENKRRVASPDRAEHRKLLDPDCLDEIYATTRLMTYAGHPNRLALDVTHLDADAAAAAIASHLAALVPEAR